MLRRWPLLAFAAWSAYVWVTRILNAWAPDSEETTAAKAVSTAIAVVLLVGAAATVAIAWWARSRPVRAAEAAVVRLVAGATVAVWLVRAPLILLADHGVPFKVVHTALAVVSIVLAGLAWRVVGRDRAEDPDVGLAPAGALAGGRR